MDEKKLIIIGAGGHGKVLADIATQMKQWEEIVFLDDTVGEEDILGFKIIGTSLDIAKYQNTADFIIALGDNRIRERFYHQLKSLNISIATLIHPKAIIASNVEISEGTVIMPGAIINVSSRIGKGTIINTGATVDHDCIIGDFIHLSPGVHIAGGVSVGDRTWLGIGSSVINGTNISHDVVIGAGSCVITDILNEGTYVGLVKREGK